MRLVRGVVCCRAPRRGGREARRREACDGREAELLVRDAGARTRTHARSQAQAMRVLRAALVPRRGCCAGVLGQTLACGCDVGQSIRVPAGAWPAEVVQSVALECGEGDEQVGGTPGHRPHRTSGGSGHRGGDGWEHVFARLRIRPDGSGVFVRRATRTSVLVAVFVTTCCKRSCTDGRGESLGVSGYTVAPREDQTSILICTRRTTSEVNSVVPAWPPRSGVRTPSAVASSTDS